MDSNKLPISTALYPESPFKLQGHVVFPFVGSFRESENKYFCFLIALVFLMRNVVRGRADAPVVVS